jgi:SAM-dependent methyltransferase
MTPVGTNGYYLAFANYVLEHVENLHKAVHEIYRVLCPSGIFVTSLPNPAAPEFIFARYSPLWFHRMIRQSEAWETVYSYSSISELTSVFESEGFIILDVKYWPITEGYLWRYPIVSNFSGRYDRMVSKLNIKRLMGSVCITVKKPAA